MHVPTLTKPPPPHSQAAYNPHAETKSAKPYNTYTCHRLGVRHGLPDISIITETSRLHKKKKKTKKHDTTFPVHVDLSKTEKKKKKKGSMKT